MPPVFSKQKRATLTDQALRQIREAIRSGKLKPGDRLVEAQLAQEMHISRFPIREALRYLEKEGLVHTEPFKGSYVAQLTEKDMEAIKGRKIRPAQKAIRDHFNLATAVIGQGYWERNTQKKKAKGKQA